MKHLLLILSLMIAGDAWGQISGVLGTTNGTTTLGGGGSGLLSVPLSSLSQSSATSGQVVEWNGSAWVATDVSGVTIPNTITSTNFVLNTVYTNTSGSVQLVDASVLLTPASIVGAASLSLYADQSGGNTFSKQDQARIVTLIGSLAMPDTRNLIGAVSNNAAYYFTNDSSGAGNSGAIVAGTGELITLSDGAAAGVATIAAANTFTGNNTFTGASTYSNNIKIDVTHALFVSNATPSRVAAIGADNTLTNLNSIDSGTALQLSGNKLIPISTEVVTNGATQNIALGGGLTNNSAAGFNGNAAGLTNYICPIFSGQATLNFSSTSSRYFCPNGITGSDSSSAAQYVGVGRGGILTNFHWQLTGNSLASGTNAYFVVVTNANGVTAADTPVSGVLLAGTTLVTSGTTSVLVPDDVFVQIRCTNTSGAIPAKTLVVSGEIIRTK